MERPSVIELKEVNNTGSHIFAKLGFMNPTGSIKDIMTYYMVKRAEESGKLKPGSEIIEVTTGNTGISLALISSLKGYKFTAVMPEHMSRERRHIMESYGANVILTPKEEDMPGALRKFKELAMQMPGAWLPMQFENPDNAAAHREITGKEILQSMNGKKIDAFVAGIGTGGTLTGVAQAVKKVNPDVKIIGVEPEESAVMSGRDAGIHGIQGIGEGFIPKLVDMKIIDEIVRIKTQDAIEMTGKLYETEGLFAGISSGANVLASIRIAERLGRWKNIVTILPDSGDRYVSMGIFNSRYKNKRGG